MKYFLLFYWTSLDAIYIFGEGKRTFHKASSTITTRNPDLDGPAIVVCAVLDLGQMASM